MKKSTIISYLPLIFLLMQTKQLRDALFNAYLDLSEGPMGTVKALAFAKLVLWTLFLESRPLNTHEIVNSTASLLEVPSVSENEIRIALDFLSARKMVEFQSGKYSIVDSKKAEMSESFEEARKITGTILDTYFLKATADREALLQWFSASNQAYFSSRADKLFKLYEKKQPLIDNLEEIITATAKEHGFEQLTDKLITGYKNFLRSDDLEVQKVIFNLIGALMSAKIVAANISPEFLNVSNYRDCEVILDTNVLFKNALFKDDGLDKTFQALGGILEKLNIKLSVTEFTKDEYERVVSDRKQLISDIIHFPQDKLQKVAEHNDFLKTALAAGCETTEDVELLFTEQLQFPSKIGNLPIGLISGSELDGSDYNQEQDRAIFERISNAWLKFRRKPKTANPTVHDLRLYKLVNKRRAKKPSFVLTCDSSMESIALEDTSDREEPLWIKLQSLIQILAVNGAGPEYNPANLAPLVRIFSEIEEIRTVEEYGAQDVQVFVQLTDRIDELPDDVIEQLLNKIHRARLRDSDEVAIFQVKRELEKYLTTKAGELSTIVEEKNQLLEKREAEINILSATVRGGEAWKIKRNQWMLFALKSLAAVALSVAIFIFLGNQIKESLQVKHDNFLFYQMLLAVSAPVLYMVKMYNNTVRVIEKKIKEL